MQCKYKTPTIAVRPCGRNQHEVNACINAFQGQTVNSRTANGLVRGRTIIPHLVSPDITEWHMITAHCETRTKQQYREQWREKKWESTMAQTRKKNLRRPLTDLLMNTRRASRGTPSQHGRRPWQHHRRHHDTRHTRGAAGAPLTRRWSRPAYQHGGRHTGSARPYITAELTTLNLFSGLVTLLFYNLPH